jgi:hypothetical protein
MSIAVQAQGPASVPVPVAFGPAPASVGAPAVPAPAVPAAELAELHALMAQIRVQLAMPGYREDVLLVYVQLLDHGISQLLARETCDRLQERAAAGEFRGPQERRAAARALLSPGPPPAARTSSLSSVRPAWERPRRSRNSPEISR